MIVGVVGKSGAGKNKIASYLESKGFNHYDFDKYAHRGLSANKIKLRAFFGEEIFYANGKVNRHKLGEIVFSNPKKLKKLETILWKWIDRKVEEDLKEDAVLNAALLHTSPLVDRCDVVFYVYTPLLTRIKRLLKRDNRSLREILKRLRNQKSINRWQYKKPKVVWNLNEKKLYKKIDRVLEKHI